MVVWLQVVGTGGGAVDLDVKYLMSADNYVFAH
jgi:hypothetical protein